MPCNRWFVLDAFTALMLKRDAHTTQAAKPYPLDTPIRWGVRRVIPKRLAEAKMLTLMTMILEIDDEIAGRVR